MEPDRQPADGTFTYQPVCGRYDAHNNQYQAQGRVSEEVQKDFNITGGGLRKMFLGMKVEQDNKTIKLHLDHHVHEMLTKYKDYIKKSL